jgi:hypothetical protein
MRYDRKNLKLNNRFKDDNEKLINKLKEGVK